MNGFTIQIPGPPPRKNARHLIGRRHGRGAMRNSEAFTDFVTVLKCLASEQRLATIREGAWRLSVTAYWPSWRHLDGERFPFGDHDAPLSWISDALELADLIDDDVRIVESATRKHHNKESPGVVIKMERIDG